MYVHQWLTQITANKFKNNTKFKKIYKYLGRLKEGSTAPDALRYTKQYKYMNSSSYHGDPSGYKAVKNQYIKSAAKYYKARKYKKAAWRLGIACHTAQDYYAHNIKVYNLKSGMYSWRYFKQFSCTPQQHIDTFDNPYKDYTGRGWKNIANINDNQRIKNSKAATTRVIKRFLKKI